MDRDYMKALPQYVNSDKYSFWRYIRFKPEIKLKYVYYYDTVVNKQWKTFTRNSLLKIVPEGLQEFIS